MKQATNDPHELARSAERIALDSSDWDYDYDGDRLVATCAAALATMTLVGLGWLAWVALTMR